MKRQQSILGLGTTNLQQTINLPCLEFQVIKNQKAHTVGKRRQMAIIHTPESTKRTRKYPDNLYLLSK